MKVCHKCNFNNNDSDKFCINCGEFLSHSEIITINNKKKKEGTTMSIISLILFIVIILANVIVYPLSLTDSETSGMYWFFLVLLPSIPAFFVSLILSIISIFSYFKGSEKQISNKKKIVTIINIFQTIIMSISLILIVCYLLTW